MSAKLMGQVYDLVLSPSERDVLMALADHAQHDGTGCRPSVALLAWKIDRSERCVQYTLRKLEEKRLIIPVAFSSGGRGTPTEYHIHLENGTAKPPFRPSGVKGANFSPIPETSQKGAIVVAPFTEKRVQTEHRKGAKPNTVRVQNDAQKGATAIAPEPPNRNLEPLEPSPLSPNGIAGDEMGGDANASKDDEMHATFVALMGRDAKPHETEKWAGALALAREKRVTPAMLREAWRRACVGPRKFSSPDYVRPWSLMNNWQRWEMGPIMSGLAQVQVQQSEPPHEPPPPPPEPSADDIARADAARAEIADMFAERRRQRQAQEIWRRTQGIWTKGHQAHCPCVTCKINETKAKREGNDHDSTAGTTTNLGIASGHQTGQQAIPSTC